MAEPGSERQSRPFGGSSKVATSNASVWLDWRHAIDKNYPQYGFLDLIDTEIQELKVWEDEAKQAFVLNNLEDPTLVRLKCQEDYVDKEKKLFYPLYNKFSTQVQGLEPSFNYWERHLYPIYSGPWPNDKAQFTESQAEAKAEFELRTKGKSEMEALLRRISAPPEILELWKQLNEFYHENERLWALDRLHQCRSLMARTLMSLDSSNATRNRETISPSYPTSNDGTNIWAVVIGIDQYTTTPALEGAVHDARNMEDYLLNYLGAPRRNICLLIDHDATRNRILEAISQHLTNNVALQRDDIIIIYYAGHGSSYEAQEGWYNGIGSIEALCPVDRSTVDSDGSMVLDISDREIFFMLEDLRNEKGNNITLILDCCHSSGISRGDQKEISGAKVRAAKQVPSDVSNLLEKATMNPYRLSDYSSATKVEWTADMENIAMLAACHDYEAAWEVTVDGVSYGAFTTALLNTLKANPLAETTYAKVIQDIGPLPSAKVPRQHPLAIGGRIENSPFSASQQVIDRAKEEEKGRD